MTHTHPSVTKLEVKHSKFLNIKGQMEDKAVLNHTRLLDFIKRRTYRSVIDLKKCAWVSN